MADLSTKSAAAGERLASATLTDKRPETVRGHLDRLDRLDGVSGWALDLKQPGRPVRLQLVVDEVVVAECETGGKRDDLVALLGRDTRPGFHFPPEALAGLKALLPDRHDKLVRVRFAEPRLVLKSKIPAPPLGLFMGHLDGPDANPVAVTPRAPVGTAFDLLARLSDLRTEAQPLTEQVFRPANDRPSGRIEAAAIDDNGCVWLIGWMRRSDVVDFPVVVVDRQKIAGGFSFTHIDREDLGPGASGFLGVLLSDWRPAAGSEVYLYLNGDPRQQIQGLRPLRLMSKTDFFEHFSNVQAQCHTGNTQALQRMLASPISWAPTPRNALPAQVAVDEVLVLPSFGCIATGWVLSPLKPVESLTLKLGATILRADPASLTWKARADLASIYPGCDKLIERAGFVGVFPGVIPATDLGGAVLKVGFGDDDSANYAVETQALRRLGTAVDLNAVLRLYPALDAEPFFPALAKAAKQEQREQMGPIQPYSVAPARCCFIFAAPSDRSDLFLLIDRLSTMSRLAGPDVGVVLVGSSSALRAETIILFEDLATSVDAPCSLIFVDDGDYAFHHLPEILKAVEAERFLFGARDIHVTRGGGEISDILRTEDVPMAYVQIEQSLLGQASQVCSSECFLSSTAPFLASFPAIPFKLGGYAGDLKSPTGGPAAIITGAAQRIGWTNTPRILAKINNA
ncbi:MAG: hypothetical protein B7Y99_03085 [Caulobacterales bacterium 32-69-10]|nr:MAG: hypothetical protein B7Y99_03085 [Caulobacterales bacterium 32-69-10]